ncbi:hypothetical protein DOTSEDRAFT_70995 [Dothistroma septosporum NZE10]|uniref:Uncharacterized protein n=1 Tax=Dothistroma septosporum (strain NZE10 / CBS 128990) TaxID=675120 RepID=N1PP12_DOTSN|nr:hypothetical protein DOTSEDRAFT_70995 [Dothistroma septosporum NZE10]
MNPNGSDILRWQRIMVPANREGCTPVADGALSMVHGKASVLPGTPRYCENGLLQCHTRLDMKEAKTNRPWQCLSPG